MVKATGRINVRYEVFGPFELHRKSTKAGTRLDLSNQALAAFWERAESVRSGLAFGAGCYLFAVRAARGIRPWYAGQSKGAFEKEVFAHHKREVYREVMGDSAKGTPVLFLIARLTDKGKLSKSVPKDEADFVERQLIRVAWNANAQLKNIANTRFLETLQVPGVLNSPPGAPTEAVKNFRTALGI